jgi:quinol monooxygenase YgiN
MIVMMGYIHLEPSDVPEFLAELETIAAGTRAERGCLLSRAE